MALTVGSSSKAYGQEFSVADIGTLGGSASFAYGINNRGEIAGQSWTPGDLATHTFVYRQGVLADLDPFIVSSDINNRGQIAGWFRPASGTGAAAIFDRRDGMKVLGTLGGHWAVADAINNLGQAVGWSYLAGGEVPHAFVYADGKLKDIHLLGQQSAAAGINDFGVVVGNFLDDRGVSTQHAFVYRDGFMSEINPFNEPANLSNAVGINNKGQVVGWGVAADSWRGFIEKDGVVTDLGGYFPYAINDKGQVVGSFMKCAPTCVEHAFMYADGKAIDLNAVLSIDSQWELIAALDINERGDIVGYGWHNGQFRGFVLTSLQK